MDIESLLSSEIENQNMKIGTLLYTSFLLFFLASCGKGSSTSVQSPVEQAEQVESSLQKESKVDSTKLGAYKILEYVCLAKEETDARKSFALPDEESAVIESFYQGDSVAVISSDGEWLQVLDIPWNRMGERPDDDYGVKVGFIKKENLGDINDLKVSLEDLLTISYWSGGDIQTRVLTESDTLQLEEISKEEFYKNKKTVKIPFEFNDTIMGGVSKQHGMLTIPCRDKTIKLKDVSYEESIESAAEYTYLGKWEALNLHGVHKSGNEHLEAYLFDSGTGSKVADLTHFPVVSPDGQYIVDIWGNPYEETSEFILCKRSQSGEIKILSSFYFPKWVPARANYGSFEDYYFGGDGALYIRTVKSNFAGQFIGDNQAIWQYVRIRLNI